MIDPYKPKDMMWWLGAAHRRIGSELRGEHGDPGRTALARFVAALLVVLFAGSTLWAAFTAMLPTLMVVAALVLVLRLVRRFLGR